MHLRWFDHVFSRPIDAPIQWVDWTCQFMLLKGEREKKLEINYKKEIYYF